MQKIYAHRGASGYAPENTLEAFELAAKMGADGVELDVHMTLPELKKLRFNKTHPEYESAAIPTLREVYELLKPLGLNVNTELKTSRIRILQSCFCTTRRTRRTPRGCR